MFETVISLLVALSIASERLVEIIKGLVPYLNVQKADENQEARRKVAIHILAVVAGVVTTLLARLTGSLPADLPAGWNTPVGTLAIGFLVSGGSGLWNGILSYVLQIKDLKKIEVQKANQ